MCIYIYIYIYIMHCSSNELGTSVPDSVKCKQKEVNTYTLNSLVCIESAVGLRYQADVKLA